MRTHHPQRVRVVIADNEPLSNDRIKEMAAANFEVVPTLRHGGEDILSQALELRPDVVLINIAVLGGSGFKLIKRIIEEMPHTRVVMYQNDQTNRSSVGKVSLRGASMLGRRDLAPEIASPRELSNRE